MSTDFFSSKWRAMPLLMSCNDEYGLDDSLCRKRTCNETEIGQSLEGRIKKIPRLEPRDGFALIGSVSCHFSSTSMFHNPHFSKHSQGPAHDSCFQWLANRL